MCFYLISDIAFWLLPSEFSDDRQVTNSYQDLSAADTQKFGLESEQNRPRQQNQKYTYL